MTSGLRTPWLYSPAILLLGLGALMAIDAVLLLLLIILALIDLLNNASRRR